MVTGLRLRFWRHPVQTPPRAPVVPGPAPGVPDLAEFLFKQMGAIPPALRQQSCWVMDEHWMRACERLAGKYGTPPRIPELPPYLLGIAVQVETGGGYAHLEPVSRQVSHTA